MTQSGVDVEHSVTHFDGVPKDFYTSNLSLAILHGSPTGFSDIRTAYLILYEEDGTWNARDEYFNGRFTNLDNANARGTLGYPAHGGGSSRCGYVKNGYPYNCPFVNPINGSSYFWAEVNFNVYWVR